MEKSLFDLDWRKLTGRWLALVTVAVGGAAVVSLAAGWWWVMDLASPFQVQYAVALALCAGGLLACGMWRWALVALLLAGLPAARVAPSWIPPKQQAPVAGEARLRVLAFNVLSSNRRHEEVRRWVRDTAPDVAVFPEVTLAWARQLVKLADILPHAVVQTQEGNFGMAVLSKYPLRAERVTKGPFDAVLGIRVELDVNGRVLVIHGVHPVPPLGGTMAAERDHFLRDLAAEAGDATVPVVMLGDFNATPWCHGMKPLHAASLRDAREGCGPVATWRRRMPWVAIPIDHVLVNGAVRVDGFRTGPDLGSDHRPVVADLRW